MVCGQLVLSGLSGAVSSRFISVWYFGKFSSFSRPLVSRACQRVCKYAKGIFFWNFSGQSEGFTIFFPLELTLLRKKILRTTDLSLISCVLCYRWKTGRVKRIRTKSNLFWVIHLNCLCLYPVDWLILFWVIFLVFICMPPLPPAPYCPKDVQTRAEYTR